MDELLAEFLTETNESLAELDVALVKLERTPDDEQTLSLIFRLVHTIKGTCGFLGLPRLKEIAHAAEHVLGRVRDRELAATPGVVSAVLGALDRIRAILAGLAATGAEPAGDDGPLVAMLGRAASGHAHEAAPALSQADASPAELVPATQTIRVNVDLLEELMTLVGELVLTRNQLLQVARASGTSAYSVPLQRLSNVTADLQKGVMKTRMQPIGSAWNKLPRLVRDLAHETGKKIALEMHGQDTGLDRQVLELMRDPLTHMVRNAADHGLETPAMRRAAGKPETGRIVLNAYHEGGHVIIDIEDDGYGLNVERIRAKVLQNGLASEAEIAAMTDQQIRTFIFRAGFSTASAVTSISGRGVGMDVVRSNIERIGGSVELTSICGHGTRFSIKIPLTLAIVQVLIVRVCGQRFAVPQINVLELVRVRTGQSQGTDLAIEHIGQTPVLRLRDQLLPIVFLADALALRADGACAAASQATVVVAAIGSGMLGIVVDEVIDTEEIVVKPVAPILRHVTMFSGNTILGDGSVVMILDPSGVARSAGVASSTARPAARASIARAATSASDGVALLLFRAADDPAPRVVPLSLVARLEAMPRAAIERSANGFLTQYRGRLMPLLAMGSSVEERASQAVLVFNEGDRAMGLMVDEIVDVVHGRLDIELGSARPGLLGTAIIAGQAADVLDTGYWLTQARQDWFVGARRAVQRRRLLVVEDSDFIRNMLVPTLSAHGYEVTASGSATQALRLREGGLMVDAIVSDIDMPGMDGLAFARELRAGGPWMRLPIIALTGRDAARGCDAGFTDYCRKHERGALVESLRRCLAEQVVP